MTVRFTANTVVNGKLYHAGTVANLGAGAEATALASYAETWPPVQTAPYPEKSYLIRAAATRTFTSNTSQQAIFASPNNGALTLPVGVYEFSAVVSMDTMDATSGNGKFSLIGAGTATLSNILWVGWGLDSAVDTAGTISGVAEVVATQTATNLVTASTATVLTFMARGTFEVTAAGTVIPSFAQTTAAAAVVKVGSYFRCTLIGDTGAVSYGPWS